MEVYLTERANRKGIAGRCFGEAYGPSALLSEGGEGGHGDVGTVRRDNPFREAVISLALQ